jgi:putative hemolysin
MNSLVELTPWLIAMVVLIGFSAFFSASEAAFFSLRTRDIKKLKKGSAAARIAAGLLSNPDRLLSAILFWNLLVNVSYFAISAICVVRLETGENASAGAAATFAIVSLLTIIFFSEMIPKSVAVLVSVPLTRWFAIPVSLSFRLVAPLLPLFEFATHYSRRLVWPDFQIEEYIGTHDIERAIELSAQTPELISQERTILDNIVQLSQIRVDEWMNPRNKLLIYQPPVLWNDVARNPPPGGYVLIAEQGTEEIAFSLRVSDLIATSSEPLDARAMPVVYLPWCASVAAALKKLQLTQRRVCVIVNEYGESIGMLSMDDIVDSVFHHSPSRVERLLEKQPVVPVGPDQWTVSGLVSLRRLSRVLRTPFLPTQAVTVSGLVQEELQDFPKIGDSFEWSGFQFVVGDLSDKGDLEVLVSRLKREEQG